jgi:hypothetical protein
MNNKLWVYQDDLSVYPKTIHIISDTQILLKYPDPELQTMVKDLSDMRQHRYGTHYQMRPEWWPHLTSRSPKQ